MEVVRQFSLFFCMTLMLLLPVKVQAQEGALMLQLQKQATIRETIGQPKLNYPQSTKRFYQANGSQLIWIKKEDQAAHTFQAMLLLDCVLQYGLSHADYHRDILTYDKLQLMTKQPLKVSDEEKSAFDIMLTDAIISLINNLHYGKFNPLINQRKIDQGKVIHMRADQELARLIKLNDLAGSIAKLQPQTKSYQDLQHYLRLVRGQYTGDCYEIPEAEARLAAINMERLRWVSSAKSMKKSVPAKYSYQTLEIKDGLPVTHNDRYQQDKALEKALFGINSLAKTNNANDKKK